MTQSFTTPQAILYHRETATPDQPFLHQPTADGWRRFTWGDCVSQARRLATALRGLGLKPGDRVSIFSRNCAEWLIADYALLIGGYISVPIYSSASEDTVRHILEHSEAKAVFVGKLDHPEAQDRGIPAAVTRIAMPYPTITCQLDWDALISANEPLKESWEPEPEELMTLLYTSGSTGQPKGAMHSYASFLYAGQHIGEALALTKEDRLLSYLPLAHCTERAYVEATSLVFANQLWFVHEIDTFGQNLKDCQPTFFGSVPRLWKVFQLQILAQMPAGRLAFLLKLPVISGAVKRKIKAGMGLGDSRWFMSGSAPIAASLLEWWEALDMPISEGWGMTETFAYGTLLAYGEPIRRGSIGKACPGTDLRISDNGELEIRTQTLMQGYYKNPESTAESMTEDGFFRTGDRAEIDGDGYVKITGRVKDIFKTAKGKYVAPVPIESRLARNPHVELVCLVGSGLTQPVALVQLTEAAQALDKSEVSQSFEEQRVSLNESLEPHAKIGHVVVVNDTWDTENGMLTPTLKVRRHAVEAHYGAAIAAVGAERVTFL
ncbi:MAG: AMP-binding protein [Pseudomonadota bacterium]